MLPIIDHNVHTHACRSGRLAMLGTTWAVSKVVTPRSPREGAHTQGYQKVLEELPTPRCTSLYPYAKEV